MRILIFRTEWYEYNPLQKNRKVPLHPTFRRLNSKPWYFYNPVIQRLSDIKLVLCVWHCSQTEPRKEREREEEIDNSINHP